MIQGLVNASHEAVLRLRVRGPTGIESDIEVIVDTGFTASLTLPLTMANALGLARESSGTAALGDGSVHQFDIYAAEVEWDGMWRTVLVSAAGNESLLGMRLLAGNKLVVEAVPGGTVEISPLP